MVNNLNLNIEDTLSVAKPLSVDFVQPNTGEIFKVPSSRYRTIVDLKSYDDGTVNNDESIVDTTGFIPLKEQIARFFPTGEFPVIEGYEDVEDFDSEDVIDDKLDYVDYLVDKKQESESATPVADISQKPLEQEKNASSDDVLPTSNEQANVLPQSE